MEQTNTNCTGHQATGTQRLVAALHARQGLHEMALGRILHVTSAQWGVQLPIAGDVPLMSEALDRGTRSLNKPGPQLGRVYQA